MTPPNPHELKPCREVFEAWYSDEGHVPENVERFKNGSYRKRNANAAWTVWQAAWNARAGVDNGHE